jgi:hypothetical protein
MSCNHWLDRRRFLGDMADGLKGIALAMLLNDRAAAEQRAPHFAPRAKRVIQIFCPGAVSQIDTFDYKPELSKHAGEPLPGEEKMVSFQGANGNLLGSPWQMGHRHAAESG